MITANAIRAPPGFEETYFSGKGKLVEFPMLSKRNLSCGLFSDSRSPIVIVVVDLMDGVKYDLDFIPGSQRTPVSGLRSSCIEELVRATRKGAELFVEGILIRPRGLEEGIDYYVNQGIISVAYEEREVTYAYVIDKITGRETVLMNAGEE
jgi:hypothetical protein